MATKPRFRAEHVGSFLRPKELRNARDKFEGDQYREVRGSIAARELHELEDRCIRDVVALQEKVGLKVITDGDFRRRSWAQDFILAIEGTAARFTEVAIGFADEKGEKLPTLSFFVEGKLRRAKPITLADYSFLKSLTARTTKVTMPAPPILHFFGGRRAVDSVIYPDLEQFWDDLVAIYQAEIAALAAAGCSYVQLDEVILALMGDPRFRQMLTARGDDPTRTLEKYAEVINRAIARRPPGMTIAMHLCRGNNRGKWLGDGGYDFVADIMFNAIKVDAYLMEYDSPRAGDFAPLRFVPPDKAILLGLVTTKTAALESSDEIKRRIDEAAKHVAFEQLGLCPQCGFGSNFMGNPLTIEDEVKKLELVVSVVDQVWGD
jgi:5-methyltetrahydropteroyltriglutamate--homocysteine methyltransferase